jgi:hypothetical protein
MGSSESIYEKRLVNRLQMYWDRARGQENVPFSNEFSGSQLQDVWQSCIQIKVTTTGEKNLYYCEFMGSSLKQPLGKDLKDKYFSSVETGGMVSREFIKVLDQSVMDKKFITSQGQFINSQSKVVKYRDCVMPFKDLEGKIDMLVVGLSWRTF